MTYIFNKDFQDFLVALNDTGVEYLLVGGYAVVLHGYHRTTGDMDVWINPTKENYRRMINAFTAFGLPPDAISESDFLTNESMDVYTFGRPPVCLDIMSKVKGLEFSECYYKALEDSSQGFNIKLISYNHLIASKKAAGRLRDLNDIQKLEEE